MIQLLLLVASVVLFLIGAILAFRWFGTNPDPQDALGWVSVGLATFAAAHIPFDR